MEEPAVANNERRRVVEGLNQYITEYEEWLNGCIQGLGFTRDQLKKEENSVECPVDRNHIVPRERLESHVKYCKARKKGYSKDEIDDIELGSSFFYENSSSVVSVKLDEDTFNEVIKRSHGPNKYGHFSADAKRAMPLTGERAQYELRREEKLALYDHVVAVARQKNPSSKISEQELLLLQDSKDKKENAKGKSYLERLAEERDFKRRRQSYRAKNVHVTKKSHTEIIREVIGNQMEILGQMWEEDSSQDNSANKQQWSEERKQSPEVSKKKRDRSRSRSRNGRTSEDKRSKHSKKRSRDRSRSRSRKSKHKHKKHKHEKDH